MTSYVSHLTLFQKANRERSTIFKFIDSIVILSIILQKQILNRGWMNFYYMKESIGTFIYSLQYHYQYRLE
jgi:hypothetical protein